MVHYFSLSGKKKNYCRHCSFILYADKSLGGFILWCHNVKNCEIVVWNASPWNLLKTPRFSGEWIQINLVITLLKSPPAGQSFHLFSKTLQSPRCIGTKYCADINVSQASSPFCSGLSEKSELLDRLQWILLQTHHQLKIWAVLLLLK